MATRGRSIVQIPTASRAPVSTVVWFDDASHPGPFARHASQFVKLIEQAVAATVG